MSNVSLKRTLYLSAIFLISLYAGCFFGEDLRASEKPSEYIGVTFSILAASLFAVVSIIGDPGMILSGNWRIGWESAKSIQVELQRFNLIFVVYLLTLGLLVVSEVIEHQKYEGFYWVFNALAFFASLGFLWSLSLPFDLARIQRRRLIQEIEQRRKKNE